MNTQNNTIELKVDGMTCVNCAKSVTRLLEKKGLKKVDVNLATKTVSFTEPAELTILEIAKGIEGIGYGVEYEHIEKKPSFWNLERKFLVAALFSLPLFAHMFISWGPLHDPLVQLILSLPVFAIGVMHFGRSAFYSAKSGILNMDVLIFMGSTAAMVYSVAGFVLHLGSDYLFFETAAMVITLVLLGNLLEDRSVQKTSDAIKSLTDLQVDVALKILTDPNGKERLEEVAVGDLMIGDRFLVKEGDRIPADSRIITGSALVDESLLTGESFPVEKVSGDNILGGAILTRGNIRAVATRVGQQSFLSKIIDLVKSAQQDKPQIQQLGDKVSSIFVPLVLVIATLTLLLSWLVFGVSFQQSLLNSIAVLVISCPCAMGLATPTAVMVGVGRAAKNGILIKGGRTLEKLAMIRKVVFDKTGTLTTGEFELKDIQTLNGYSKEEVKSILKGLELYSSHPIARSLVKALENVQPHYFKEVEEMKGLGIKGMDETGKEFSLGSYKTVRHLTADQAHHLYLSQSDQLIASIDIQDEVTTSADPTVSYFKNKAIETVILSGDRQTKTKSLADKLGVEKYFAEQTPKEKLHLIEAWSQAAPTAMVGDGVNDAPALSRAFLGISLSDGSAAAIDSADVVLLNGKLDQLETAHRIGTHTLRTIRQNLFWAFSYNVIAIPIAAVGLLNPMWAALFMAFSDIVVIGNSLRLKRKRLRD